MTAFHSRITSTAGTQRSSRDSSLGLKLVRRAGADTPRFLDVLRNARIVRGSPQVPDIVVLLCSPEIEQNFAAQSPRHAKARTPCKRAMSLTSEPGGGGG